LETRKDYVRRSNILKDVGMTEKERDEIDDRTKTMAKRWCAEIDAMKEALGLISCSMLISQK
jgi:hypothetical protein